MNDPGGQTIHASAVVTGSRGILIRGTSGSGKSSLALAIIDDPRMSATLIGDDRIVLAETPEGVVARAAPAIGGMIEVRGVGIVTLDHADEALINLVVDLVPAESCPRYPSEEERRTQFFGRSVPRLALPIGVTDGALRVRMALREWTD